MLFSNVINTLQKLAKKYLPLEQLGGWGKRVLSFPNHLVALLGTSYASLQHPLTFMTSCLGKQAGGTEVGMEALKSIVYM